jgi:Ca-activated chloride channel family protein
MWIDGKETAGELLPAKEAKTIYTDIVRRTQDPGLLEYLESGLMRMSVFPIPPKADQKVKIRYTAVLTQDAGAVEYLYPMKTDGIANRTLEEFSLKVTVKSQKPIQSIYSPTHAIDTRRNGENEAVIEFEQKQAFLDKDFQVFYSTGTKSVGLTPVLYRPITNDDGYFMMLVSPRIESTMTRVPRDLVLVLDTSGSMSDLKMSQAKLALKQLLKQLKPDDRFGLVSFATAVRTYQDTLQKADAEQLERAEKWVTDLRPGGGTAIKPALDTALNFREADEARSFTVVFFTDGQPTVDERNPAQIVKGIVAKNTANTRIFTFGVGDDVNAAMLDQLADATRAASTYVRPAEDIEQKATALATKISNPVLTNLRLTSTNVRLLEVYPQQLPDLFQGSQLVLFGRFQGSGPAVVTLTGKVGKEEKTFEYPVDFPTKADNGHDFVEALWARRKVGFILDQIRINGEQKELVEEVTLLAKRYGIATPYTSYLVVPDAPLPVVNDPKRPVFFGPGGGALPPGVPQPAVLERAKQAAEQAAGPAAGGEGYGKVRGDDQAKQLKERLDALKPEDRKNDIGEALARVQQAQRDLASAEKNYKSGKLQENQAGRLGVDLAQNAQALRDQTRLTLSAQKQLNGRNCLDLGGIWVDEGFTTKTNTLAIKAQSEAYFRILEKYPEMKNVFKTGNSLVWLTPSGTALVIDAQNGKDRLTDQEIDQLFQKIK